METINENMNDTVYEMLKRIENKLDNDLLATRELLQEIIQRDIRPPQRPNSNAATATCYNCKESGHYAKYCPTAPVAIHPKNAYFHVIDVYENNEITFFGISGKTFDYRQQIKAFGETNWNNKLKAWIFQYNEELHTRLVDYLSTITTDIKFKTMLVSELN